MALAVGNCVPAMAAPTGWRESAAGWQYVNSNGSVQKGWFQDTKGDWYFLDYNTGIMKTGWIKPKDGKWYFMDYHTGAMKTGWIKPADGKWYYLNPNSNGTKGAMMTGWVQTPDKKWYYMDAASGAMQTGTITVNNQVWTLDANGVWDGKAATSITYVSSNRRPSGGSSGGSGTVTDKGYTFRNNIVTITDKNYDKTKLKNETNGKTLDELKIDVELKGGEGENKPEEVLVSGVTTEKLTIKDAVGEGTVILEGVIVNDETVVVGGGTESVYFRKCQLNKVRTAKSVNAGVKPLHIAFEAETKVEIVTVGGGNVILDTAILIPTLIVNSPLVVKGTGNVTNFTIQSSIAVVVQVSVKTLVIDKDATGATVEVSKEGTVEKVEGTGDATISGAGEVGGYYSVTLNADGGYWMVDSLDEETGEAKQEKSDTKTLKVEDNTAASTVIDNKDNADISFVIPTKEGYTFAGWKDDAGQKVDLEAYKNGDTTWYAIWEEGEVQTYTPTITGLSASVSGAAVTAEVSDKTASIKIASGSAATAGIASGSSVTLSDVKVTATVDNKEVEGDVTVPNTVKVGEAFDVKFLGKATADAKYEEVTISVTITITD